MAIIVLIWGGLSARLYQAACTSARSALLETIDQLARGCLAFAELACVSAVAGATTPCGAVPGLAASAGVASSMLEGCGPKDGTLPDDDWLFFFDFRSVIQQHAEPNTLPSWKSTFCNSTRTRRALRHPSISRQTYHRDKVGPPNPQANQESCVSFPFRAEITRPELPDPPP